MSSSRPYRWRARDLTLVAFIALASILSFFVGTSHAQLSPSPPTAAEVTTGRGSPVRSDPTRRTTGVGSTADGMFSADISTDLQVVTATQNLLVTNRHATQALCVWFTPLTTTGADCAAKCLADPKTCSAASGDGSPVLPGMQRAFAATGELCPCWVAAGASTTATAERIARFN